MTGATFVVGVDPGASCGYAAFRDAERVSFGQGSTAYVVAVIRELLLPVIREEPRVFAALAVERFALLPRGGFRRTAQPEALEAIGELRRVAHELGVPVMLQSPADADRFADLARDAGLRLTGNDVGRADADDVNSATRHALLWLVRHRATAIEELVTKRHR